MTRRGTRIAAADEMRTAVPADAAAAGFSVYVLRCADGTLYAGIARDVARRLAEHNGERRNGARYTAARRPVCVVYQQRFQSRSLAQREEARIKGLTRAEKQKLISAACRQG